MQKQAIPQNPVMSSGLDPSLLPCYFARLSPASLFFEFKFFLQDIRVYLFQMPSLCVCREFQ